MDHPKQKKISARESRSHLRSGAALLLLVVPFILLATCVDPYLPATTATDYHYLVIDGIMNTGGDTIRFRLTRTRPLAATDSIVPEIGARMFIEDQDGNFSRFTDDRNGNYTLAPGEVDLTKNLRMHLYTSDGNEYTSAYVSPLTTPAIDSLSSKFETINGIGGVQFFVNTHDPSGTNKYFIWSYDETWQYRSKYASSLIFQRDSITYRAPDQMIQLCFSTVSSTQVLIYSTTALGKDLISEFPLELIPFESPKLSIRYSMLVHQYAISKDAYEYWQAIQKNTENLGTIFGTLPAQITGNFTCVTDPSMPVFGFFSAATEQSKRIFFSTHQIPDVLSYDPFYADCEEYDISVEEALSGITELILYAEYANNQLIGYKVSAQKCADCRLHGGTTKTPSFW